MEEQFVTEKQLHRVYERFLDKMDDAKKDLDAYLRTLQAPYIRGLPEGFLQLLMFYTNQGDSVINAYLRTGQITEGNIRYIRNVYNDYRDYFANKDTDFYRQLRVFAAGGPQEIAEAIRAMCFMLEYVIQRAPRATRSFYVARGAQSAYVASLDSFLSTSIDANVAHGFSVSESPACVDAKYDFLKSIKIAKNTPFLYMRCVADELLLRNSLPEYPKLTRPNKDAYRQIVEEYEVLLPPKLNFAMVKSYLRKQDEKLVAQSVRGLRYVDSPYEYSICGFYLYECWNVECIHDEQTRGRSIHSLYTRKSRRKARN
jgi:hypothetical protein